MFKSALPSVLTITILLLLQLQVTLAQFDGFFSNMFGHQQQQQQQQRAGTSQFSAYLDSISCSQYLCPTTLDCVGRPSDCPCPHPEDIRCLVPGSDGLDDATVLCVRGKQECTEVEKLMNKLSKK